MFSSYILFFEIYNIIRVILELHPQFMMVSGCVYSQRRVFNY
ncbi:hypothetical protein pb186bvf_010976 [Paramecium bursaria]